MKALMKFFVIALTIGCDKSPQQSILGYWQINETIYHFDETALTIFEDGHADLYEMKIVEDSIYLDYGIPFKIELLTRDELILSKRDGDWYMTYDFVRIGR